MVVNRKIKVAFLLGVFFIMILHNSVPHVHHFHESNGEVSESHAHHHHSHTPALHSSENKNLIDDNPIGAVIESLFALFLKHHSHIIQTPEFNQVIQKVRRAIQITITPNAKIFVAFELDPKSDDIDLHRYSPFRRVIYESPYLLLNSLRAPPFLG